jgi:hypothetical protein
MIRMTEIEPVTPSQNTRSLRRWVQDRAEHHLRQAEADATAETAGRPGHDGALASERVVAAAPMSFTGSAQRIWHITQGRAGWPAAGFGALAVLAITVMWAVILVWYTIFGLWLVPFRIMRRGQRKQLRAELRHRELMATITERK